MKAFWRKNRYKFYYSVALPVIKTIMGSTRLRIENPEVLDDLESGAIICGLHARGMIACYAFRKRGFWALVSLSKDGELQNYIYTKLGHRTIRGSTGRGGARATIEAIRVLRSGKERLLVAIDGPRGPRGVVQDGVLLMAKKSGAALVPIGFSAKPRKVMRTWDFFTVPKLFAKVVIRFGEPIYVPQEATDEEVEAIRKKLEDAIWDQERIVDMATGYAPLESEKRP